MLIPYQVYNDQTKEKIDQIRERSYIYFLNCGNNWNTPNNMNEIFYNEIQFKDLKGIKKIFAGMNLDDNDLSSKSQIINSTFINFPVNTHFPELFILNGGSYLITGSKFKDI